MKRERRWDGQEGRETGEEERMEERAERQDRGNEKEKARFHHP